MLCPEQKGKSAMSPFVESALAETQKLPPRPKASRSEVIYFVAATVVSMPLLGFVDVGTQTQAGTVYAILSIGLVILGSFGWGSWRCSLDFPLSDGLRIFNFGLWSSIPISVVGFSIFRDMLYRWSRGNELFHTFNFLSLVSFCFMEMVICGFITVLFVYLTNGKAGRCFIFPPRRVRVLGCGKQVDKCLSYVLLIPRTKYLFCRSDVVALAIICLIAISCGSINLFAWTSALNAQYSLLSRPY